MKTIFLSVQTGMVLRDLLRCGPLELVLSHPEARVVLLTPGVRDAAFLEERAKIHNIDIRTLQPYIDAFKKGAPPHAGGGIGMNCLLRIYTII